MDRSGYPHVVGELQNIGLQNTELNKVVATFFDMDGKVVGASLTFSEVLPLKPGESSPFMMVVEPQVTRAMETHSLQAEGYKEG